jgi:hypothetical protein
VREMDAYRHQVLFSLRRLIIEMRRNWPLFTRENSVCHDGLPYDYEAVMVKEMTARAGGGAFWAAITGPDAWATARLAHEQFDRLDGIDPGQRAREDRLPKALLGTIESWLDGSGAEARRKHQCFSTAQTALNRQSLP